MGIASGAKNSSIFSSIFFEYSRVNYRVKTTEKMNENTVEKLHEYGAFLILLDVPRGTEFSIDWNS